jgi:hypothetical protein
LNPDQFIVAWGEGEEKVFVIRLNLNLKTLFRIFVLDLKGTDSWLVYPAAFTGQNGHRASDSEI